VGDVEDIRTGYKNGTFVRNLIGAEDGFLGLFVDVATVVGSNVEYKAGSFVRDAVGADDNVKNLVVSDVG